METAVDGRVEQDPAGYVAAVHPTTEDAVAHGPCVPGVDIGPTDQVGSLVALDRAGAPVFPCDAVLDSRCDGILAEHGREIMAANAIPSLSAEAPVAARGRPASVRADRDRSGVALRASEPHDDGRRAAGGTLAFGLVCGRLYRGAGRPQGTT
jgi:hypothetical protein